MKNRLTFVLSLIMTALCFSFLNVDTVSSYEAAVGTTPTVRYSSTLSSTYYNSVSGKTGDALLEGLASLSLTNHKYYTTYEEIKGGNAYSDKDPTNSNNLIDFYTGWSIPNDWDGGSTWNREHVWCQSLSNGLFGTEGVGSDIHHIRPSISSINSARNNGLFTDTEHCGSISLTKYYYTGTKVSSHTGDWTGCYTYNQDYWEPRDNEKGDVARILMYVYMHYSKEVSANSSNSRAGSLSITNIAYTSSKTKDAAWDMLVGWNELDPVSSFEKSRNNYCASVTGVRNPFIDHPEYANAIWGDGTLSGGSSSGDSDSSGSTDSGSTGSGSTGSTGDTTTETITTTVYRQLKSATGITSGSKIIIAAKDYNVAMNTNQKTSNRGYTTITKYTSGSDSYLNPTSTTQILTVGGSSNGNYTLYTGSGYLAATSSSANELKTRTSVTGNNCKWKINFSSGAATIVSQGSYTRNTIRYNASSKLFSCYQEGQSDVAIYKQYTETTTIVVPTPDTGPNSGSGSTSYEYPEAESLLTISKAIEVANAAGTTFTSDKYKISGTIENIENTTYGNMTIKDENGDSIYVYGVYSADGSTVYGSLENKPQVGDNITLLGVLGLYGTTPEMKNAWIVEEPHTHTIVNSYDEENHYEKCSECNETLSTEAHTYTQTRVEPTCDTEGSITYTCECGYSYQEKIDALTHSYSQPTYTWSDDHKTCTATKVCTLDESHTVSEEVSATVTEVKATCEEKGNITYVATFKDSAFETQTYVEEIEAIGHDYDDGEISKNPTEDEEGEKTFTCANCGDTYKETIEKLPAQEVPNIDYVSELSKLNTKTSIGFAFNKVGDEYEFKNVRLSWRATISKEIYDNLNIEGAGVECSIEGKSSHNIDCNDNIGIDDNGNYYILGSLSIPASQISTVITAKAYFVVDGENVYLNSTSYSLESAIKAYLSILNSLTKEQQEALIALAKFYGINV